MTETATPESAIEIAADEELRSQTAERKRLALEVRNGVAGADKELRAVERRIAELARQRELATLAEEEAQRQEAEQRERAKAAEAQDQRAQLTRLENEESLLEAKVHQAIDDLEPMITALVDVGRKRYNIAHRLGIGRQWRVRQNIANYLLNRLGPALHPVLGRAYPRDRVALPARVESDEPIGVAELLPEPPGPDLALMRPTEGLRSTHPPIASQSE